MVPYLFEIWKQKLYFAIVFLSCVALNFASEDFYSKFHQKDYKIDFHRCELIDYDKSVWNFVEVKTFKYNRTLAVVNSTLNSKVSFGTELEVEVQFYKFLSNEYRKLRGTNFQVNYCESIARNIIGLQILFKCGNMSSCQIIKDTTYTICNAYPDESRFPSFIPNGEYKLQVDLLYKDKSILIIALYIKIHRPIPRPR